MDEITLKAFAKINLTLDICGVSKGFHLLDMLVASIALCDDVRLVSSKDKSFCFMDEKLADDKNCAMRALKLMQSNFKIGNYEIHIKKGIPLSGGLGGSTADGVAVVK
ncbi:MAG: 4-(cytidine 5'-diphospho)-2-C-methyl-D-erythritol kinase, partial [Clostridia bacterium]